MKFSFSDKRTITRNTSSYPIILSDIKGRSEYFRQNPTDATLDNWINQIIIPKIIYDWEKSTGYLILDQTIQAQVPDLWVIRQEQINITFEHLNIREFSSIKYFPENWNYTDPKLVFEASDYFIIPEISRKAARLNFKQEKLPITIYACHNNLEANYKAGFQNNNFTDLNPLIKDALSSQAASMVDAKTGYCQDFDATIVEEVYSQYSINKDGITII